MKNPYRVYVYHTQRVTDCRMIAYVHQRDYYKSAFTEKVVMQNYKNELDENFLTILLLVQSFEN